MKPSLLVAFVAGAAVAANYEPTFALWLSTMGHTSPAQFGKVMAMTEPRMAVGYHFYNDHDTLPVVLEGVRTTYDGPVALATDYMVFNVTRDDVRVRMAAIDEDIWPLPLAREMVVDKSQQKTYGEFTKSGEVMMRDVLEKVWDDVNQKYGTDAKLPPAEEN